MQRRPTPTIHLATALLGLAVMAGAACDVVFQGMNAQATDQWQRSYKLEEGGLVEIVNPNGTIDVSPSADGTTVEIVAERRARAATEQAARQELNLIRITEQVSAKHIRIEVPRDDGGIHFGRAAREVSFKLRVPKTAAVKVNTRNGEVHLTGLTGAVKADSSNGSIIGDDLGGVVEAGTTNGNVRVQVRAIHPDGIRLDTTNGNIELRIPADSKANIAAHWVNGDFEAQGLKPDGASDRRRYEGKLNGGGPRIELNTTNGRIRISS
jgi:hypothetical protein